MVDLNYALAAIHKYSHSMHLKNAISDSLGVISNKFDGFNDRDKWLCARASHYSLYHSEREAIGVALILIYKERNYQKAVKYLEQAFRENPDSEIGKFCYAINTLENDPVSTNILDFYTEKTDCPTINGLLANFASSKGNIPDSMDFYIEQIKSTECRESRKKTLNLLKKAAKKFFAKNNLEFNSSTLKEIA
jgi:tetratricopeptide (TPR) repeat protein